jgi:hypothetical protein
VVCADESVPSFVNSNRCISVKTTMKCSGVLCVKIIHSLFVMLYVVTAVHKFFYRPVWSRREGGGSRYKLPGPGGSDVVPTVLYMFLSLSVV